jgi:hypothetical protein
MDYDTLVEGAAAAFLVLSKLAVFATAVAAVLP